MSIYFSLLVCVVGALVYALATNAKLVDLGRLSFFAGLLVFLLQFPGHIFTIGR